LSGSLKGVVCNLLTRPRFNEQFDAEATGEGLLLTTTIVMMKHSEIIIVIIHCPLLIACAFSLC
jgi:hypothetical protein